MDQTKVIMKDRVMSIIRETLETLGFDCVEARLLLGKNGNILKTVIFNRTGKDISMDDCSSTSNVILRRIELEYPDFSEKYDLVVESPGAEHRIENMEELKIFREKDIRFVIRNASEYGLKDNVVIGKASLEPDGNVKVTAGDAGGKVYTLSQKDISQARLYFDIKKYL